jgi:hypothetical protein
MLRGWWRGTLGLEAADDLLQLRDAAAQFFHGGRVLGGLLTRRPFNKQQESGWDQPQHQGAEWGVIPWGHVWQSFA